MGGLQDGLQRLRAGRIDAVGDPFGLTADNRQRRLELVGDVSQERAPALVVGLDPPAQGGVGAGGPPHLQQPEDERRRQQDERHRDEAWPAADHQRPQQAHGRGRQDPEQEYENEDAAEEPAALAAGPGRAPARRPGLALRPPGWAPAHASANL